MSIRDEVEDRTDGDDTKRSENPCLVLADAPECAMVKCGGQIKLDGNAERRAFPDPHRAGYAEDVKDVPLRIQVPANAGDRQDGEDEKTNSGKS